MTRYNRADANQKTDRPIVQPPYKDPSVPIEERVSDLLSRMSIEEKAAQMMCVWQKKSEYLVNDDGAFDADKARKSFAHGNGIGQIGRPSDAGGNGHELELGRDARQLAELTNAIQKFFMEESRLGIPVFFHEECLHGLAAKDATSYPQPIAMASSFDPDLVQRVYDATARDARTRGIHHALTPVVDVARDPRWGRVEETFGEDPFLVATLGVSAVRGLQGDAGFSKQDHVVATLKHFAAHGQPEAGMNCGPVDVSERTLRDVFLYPFKEAIDKGGAISVMASYNEIDGVPSHANRWLLRDVLRKEWGFDGFIVSDYYAIWELYDRPDTHAHSVAGSHKEAARLAVKAGVNIDLPEPDCYLNVVELVKEGTLTEEVIDDLVAPLLRWKFRMGLFESPFVDPDEADRTAKNPANVTLAREAAGKSAVLLQNNNSILPLDPSARSRIAVIGPNANRTVLGGYSGITDKFVTVLDGIRNHVGDSTTVEYAEGCKITIGGSWFQDEVVAQDPEESKTQIAEAVAVAQRSDLVVLAIGGNEQTSREAWGRNHMGDRTSLELFGAQLELLEAIAATGKPIVAVLFNGRPLALGNVADKVDALLECWYLGQESGNAVADIIFGAVNPSGKLPISFPRSVGHLPIFYNHKPSARRGYLHDEVTPLYPFGFGLSYTKFELSDLKLDQAAIDNGQTATLHVAITNVGDRAGTEVVQLYIRDVVSSVTRPLKELKGFQRVELDAGAAKTVSFEITPALLSFHDIDYNLVVEPGEFELFVGTSSRSEDLSRTTLAVR